MDNREFKADSDGIGYRASADLDDKAGEPGGLLVVFVQITKAFFQNHHHIVHIVKSINHAVFC